MAAQVSKKRKFVADGVFKAELNEFLTRELAEDGYSGVEVRVTPTRTEIIIMATRTQNVLGEKGGGSGSSPVSSRRGEMGGNYEIVVKCHRLGEICLNFTARFNFPEGTVELYAEKVQTRGLCAIAQVDLEHTSNKMFCRHKVPLTLYLSSGRVPEIQADRRSCREARMLWCP